jgi:DNA-binding transcriptional MerR regulator
MSASGEGAGARGDVLERRRPLARIMTDEPLEPQDEQPDETPEPERRGMDLHEMAKKARRKGVSIKEAERALKKWQKREMRATDWDAAGDFGEFLIGKGKKAIGVAIQVFAANRLTKSIENCERLQEEIADQELKVRLEETIKGCCESIGKLGQGLTKDEAPEPSENKNPTPPLPAFPANIPVNVQIVNNSGPSQPMPAAIEAQTLDEPGVQFDAQA